MVGDALQVALLFVASIVFSGIVLFRMLVLPAACSAQFVIAMLALVFAPLAQLYVDLRGEHVMWPNIAMLAAGASLLHLSRREWPSIVRAAGARRADRPAVRLALVATLLICAVSGVQYLQRVPLPVAPDTPRRSTTFHALRLLDLRSCDVPVLQADVTVFWRPQWRRVTLDVYPIGRNVPVYSDTKEMVRDEYGPLPAPESYTGIERAMDNPMCLPPGTYTALWSLEETDTEGRRFRYDDLPPMQFRVLPAAEVIDAG